MWALFFLVALTIGSFDQCQGGFSSQSQAGSIYVNDYGEISCDDLLCPKDTFKCRIVRESIKNTRNMDITRTCLDQTGKALAEEHKTTLAPYEGFNAYVEADRNGNFISDGRKWSPEEQAKLASRIGEINAETAQINQRVQKQVSQVLYDLNNNLANTFANIFGRR